MIARFSSPPDPQAFDQQVWQLVSQIPPGRVSTYGRLAAMLPPPAGVDPGAYLSLGPRWVGGSMARCPQGVPWQRVINAQGRISPRQGLGPEKQRALLAAEGVVFDGTGRVDLSVYGWAPADEEAGGLFSGPG